jgi:hypothetical protein
MFDVGFEPWGDPPPFGMPVFIVTHEEREPMPMQGGRITAASDPSSPLTRAQFHNPPQGGQRTPQATCQPEGPPAPRIALSTLTSRR